MVSRIFEDPIVNINGSSKQSLLDDNSNIRAALENVLDVLAQAAPHGRNYQGHPYPESALGIARTNHSARYQQIEALITEYTRQALVIDGHAWGG